MFYIKSLRLDDIQGKQKVVGSVKYLENKTFEKKMFYTKVSSNVKRQHLILTTDMNEFSKTTSKMEPQLFIQYSCS